MAKELDKNEKAHRFDLLHKLAELYENYIVRGGIRSEESRSNLLENILRQLMIIVNPYRNLNGLNVDNYNSLNYFKNFEDLSKKDEFKDRLDKCVGN